MTKKWLVAVLILLVSSGVAASENWTIKNLDVAAEIRSDGVVALTETITADFSAERGKHGIFRMIPFRYEDDRGKNFTMPLQVSRVTDGAGRTRPYKITTEGDNKKIRIGDPNRTVGSTEVYQISYTVDRSLQRFDSHDEFYWNVTGHDWPVAIETSSLEVSLPRDSDLLQTKCFTGRRGSISENCTAESLSDRTVKFQTNGTLSRGEGWTVVFGFDHGVATVAGRDYEPILSLLDVLGIGLTFPPLGLLWWIWDKRKKRKDILRVDHPIIPMYDPPEGLLPAGVGTLRDNKLDARDISAAVVSLAVRGYLTITEIKSGLLGLSRDFLLTRTQKSTEDVESFDTGLVAALFALGTEVRFSDLKNSFYTSIPILESAVEQKLKNGGLFRTKKITLIYEVLGVWGIFVLAIFLAKNLEMSGWFFVLNIVMLLFGNILIATFPAKKTVRGAQVAHEIKCYREFLMTAEEDRMEWAEKQNIFEKNLPYAIALGVANIWAKRFADLVKIPDWYRGDRDFRMDRFGDRMDDLSHDFHDTAMAAPKSSGSGFSGGSSGGGGGGGGGGSW